MSPFCLLLPPMKAGGFSGSSVVKNPPATKRMQEVTGSTPGLGRCPEGHDNPRQDSPGQNPRAGCHLLLQGIFPIELRSPVLQADSLARSHQGSLTLWGSLFAVPGFELCTQSCDRDVSSAGCPHWTGLCAPARVWMSWSSPHPPDPARSAQRRKAPPPASPSRGLRAPLAPLCLLLKSLPKAGGQAEGPGREEGS